MPPATLAKIEAGAAPPPELADMTTERLRAALGRSLEKTASELRRLAWIVRILEERGEDLSDLRIGLLGYLRRIAYGQLEPSVVVRFAESPAVLRRVAELPLPDQQRLGAGAPVRLVVRGEGGTITHREVNPAQLTAGQTSQVFGRGKLRDEAEQVLLLEDRKDRPAKKAEKPKVGRIAIDRKRGGLLIGRTFVPTAQVVEALGQLAAPGDEETADEEDQCAAKLMVNLTESQHEALRAHAYFGDTKVSRLVRRALAAYGLFVQREH